MELSQRCRDNYYYNNVNDEDVRNYMNNGRRNKQMKKTKLITKEMEEIIVNERLMECIDLHFNYGDITYVWHHSTLDEEDALIMAWNIRRYGFSHGFGGKTYHARTFRVGKYFTVWRGI